MTNFNAIEMLKNNELYSAAKKELEEMLEKQNSYNESSNEGGQGFNPYTEKVLEAIKKKDSTRLDVLAANFAQLRQEWNDWVTLNGKNGNLKMSEVTAKAKSMGLRSHTEIATIKAHAEILGFI